MEGQSMARDEPLRKQLMKLLDWEDAHVGFEAVVEGVDAALRGVAPHGMPHSPWQLLEHFRLTQHDILDFCRNPPHSERARREDYWQPSLRPPTARGWGDNVAASCP